MATSTLRVINAATVRALLPMDRCIDLMIDAMRAISRQQVALTPRNTHALIDKTGFLGTMSGSCLEPRTFGCKVMSVIPGNASKGLPTLSGVLLVFDAETGAPSALIHGATITELRTAATSALATRLLARADAKTLAVFGNGVQAAAHIDAVCRVRSIDRILVWSRSVERGAAFAASQQAQRRLPVLFEADAARACAAADIVCTTTAASLPIVTGRWVRPGTHLNLIGSHDPGSAEADVDLIAGASVYVDQLDYALRDAGEIVQAISSGAISAAQLRGELGQLVDGLVSGRSRDDEITVFKSIGLLAQDLVAAEYVVRQAQEHAAGGQHEF
jgi:ornithine cyclodeaminase/alanine dehydrogenase-like protein (mu-crystallin family)